MWSLSETLYVTFPSQERTSQSSILDHHLYLPFTYKKHQIEKEPEMKDENGHYKHILRLQNFQVEIILKNN